MMTNQNSDLLTVHEVSLRLRVNPATVYGMVKKNELQAYRIGGGNRIRIPAAAVDQALGISKKETVIA